jgi:hypothetical protein
MQLIDQAKLALAQGLALVCDDHSSINAMNLLNPIWIKVILIP